MLTRRDAIVAFLGAPLSMRVPISWAQKQRTATTADAVTNEDGFADFAQAWQKKAELLGNTGIY